MESVINIFLTFAFVVIMLFIGYGLSFLMVIDSVDVHIGIIYALLFRLIMDLIKLQRGNS